MTSPSCTDEISGHLAPGTKAIFEFTSNGDVYFDDFSEFDAIIAVYKTSDFSQNSLIDNHYESGLQFIPDSNHNGTYYFVITGWKLSCLYSF